MSDLGNKAVIAQNIRRLMEIAGKSRGQICDDLGIKYTTFTDWVNGNRYPRIDKIEMLANYFGVSKAELVESPDSLPAGIGAYNPTHREPLLKLIAAVDDADSEELERLRRIVAAYRRASEPIRQIVDTALQPYFVDA